MDKLYIIKIGGNVIDDSDKLSSFLKDFAGITEKKMLVHGGGKLATELAQKLNIDQKLIEGRRVTDKDTLKVVTMVYAGLINKTIVAELQANNCNAIGITGADGNAISADKRQHPSIDYGFVGDVNDINTKLLTGILDQHIALVIAPITHDGKGQLLNTNADTIARELANALKEIYDIELVYCFERDGVIINDQTLVSINQTAYAELKGKELIFGGMIPKLDNAFKAAANQIKVRIGNSSNLNSLVKATSGTIIHHD